jgi:two-component system, chemotaxis family, chemotaxis protein CheY
VKSLATVLITDDSMIMRMQLRKIVTELGHEVIGEAENGLVAIQKYKILRPQLVTMDITMPELGGIDAVKEIMKFDPNAIILMCSAMGQQVLILDAIQAGAKDFIVKPFDSTRIKQSLLSLLNK